MERKKFLAAFAATITSLAIFKRSNATYKPSWGGSGGLLLANRAAGKKLTIFGDSICLPSRWPNYVTNFQSVTSYAVSASTYKDYETSDRWCSTQINNAIAAGQNPDIIVLGHGTNDQETALGTYAAALAKTSLANLDRTNLHEAVRWALWKCRTQWPNAKIFVLTPLQRGDIDIVALTGLRSCLVSWANYYGAVVIDQTFEAGVCKDFEVSGGSGQNLSDGIHPNTSFQQKQADFITGKIIASMIK